MKNLNYRVIETGPNPDAAIILLHGLGADGNDFVPIVKDLKLPEEMAVRFIFPHAPEIPITINNGMVMPAWYDVVATGLDREVDTVQLKESAKKIVSLIEQQLESGIASERIIVAGFSQGGAVAYQTVLSYHKPLGGLLAMSTYFATAWEIMFHKANKQVPILLQHGHYDSVVDLQLGEQAAEMLEQHSYGFKFETYPMDHTVCRDQIHSISAWFQEILNPK